MAVAGLVVAPPSPSLSEPVPEGVDPTVTGYPAAAQLFSMSNERSPSEKIYW